MSFVTDMSSIFPNAQSFNGDISKWDVSSATRMNGMFRGAESFHGDISKWDVSSVTDMYRMFHAATSFNGDISKWGVSRVPDMRMMFESAPSFKHTLCGSAWGVFKGNKIECLRSRPDQYVVSSQNAHPQLHPHLPST